MSTLVQPDELEVTRGERFLALVLAVFVAIGLLWGYAKLDEIARPSLAAIESDPAIQAHRAAVSTLQDAQAGLDVANRELEFRREAYRTALDAGQPAQDLQGQYRQAQEQQATAQGQFDAAQKAEAATRGPGDAAQKRVDAERDRVLDRHEWITFLLRLGYVLLVLGLAFWTLVRNRRTVSRRVPLLYAVVGAATFLTIVMAGDYLSHYVTWQDVGPLVLSLVGIALSFAAFVALQRTLVRRVPGRRVRRNECPFCGYPVRSGEHCEGCGRDVVGECSSCATPRRVGTPHCAACGAA